MKSMFGIWLFGIFAINTSQPLNDQNFK